MVFFVNLDQDTTKTRNGEWEMGNYLNSGENKAC